MSKIATVTMDFDVPDNVSKEEIRAYLLSELTGTEVGGVSKENFKEIEKHLWDSEEGLWISRVEFEQ